MLEWVLLTLALDSVESSVLELTGTDLLLDSTDECCEEVLVVTTLALGDCG